MAKKYVMKYVIKKSDGNYYKRDTGIGPCFGAKKEKAFVFDSILDASNILVSHSFAFADCEIEEIK